MSSTLQPSYLYRSVSTFPHLTIVAITQQESFEIKIYINEHIILVDNIIMVPYCNFSAILQKPSNTIILYVMTYSHYMFRYRHLVILHTWFTMERASRTVRLIVSGDSCYVKMKVNAWRRHVNIVNPKRKVSGIMIREYLL